MVGRKKVAAFHSIIDRTWARATNWRTKFLPAASKEILLKAVLQAIPTYSMGIFLLPQSIIQRLNILLKKFWWGYNEDHTKIQWVKWSLMGKAKDQGGLGFRDLNSFNIAMLAKQSWRILKFPDSLLAQVFKSKYFLHSDLMEARLGNRPFFAWRSIMKDNILIAYETLHGMNTRGRGKEGFMALKLDMSKAYDRVEWSFLERVMLRMGFDVKWVNLIMKCVSSVTYAVLWKESILRSHFNPEEIEKIKAIPISLGGREDQQVWAASPSGLFNVKSAYLLHKEMINQKEGDSSSSREYSEEWKAVWHLKTSNSVKMFTWKACQDALPTLANLYKRKIVENMDCPICKLAPETGVHVLWNCETAKGVWGQGCIKIQKMAGNRTSFSEIWSQMVKNLKKEDLAEAAITARLIWFIRNTLIHGNSFTPPGLIIQAAKMEMKNFKEATDKPQFNPRCTSGQTFELWKKPPEGSYKLNWSARIDKATARVGIRAIIRDPSGQVIGTLQATRSLRTDQFTAESYALLIASSFYKESGISTVIVEGESQKEINILRYEVTDWSQGDLIIEEAKDVLSSCLSWSANLAKKEANNAACILAKNALLMCEDVYELEEISNCTLSTVLSEMM
ncbi:uncharacterized protein LOC122292147 [Carya illinoinensis]|uniref:uncharacterized protein LOC122292147 n=1 Tax=Carya illinoinensis TaxID=32201 RepID=UPI001C723FEA|nr:uncharacterized protein LOC122292147 [Carya illinoinensis]